MLLSAAIWFILVKPYSRHRPGADVFAMVVGLPLGLVAFSILLVAPNSHEGITTSSFHMLEGIYLLLLLGWFVFLLLYFSTLVFAGLAIARIPKSLSNEQNLAKQAAWTARFALALPALLFSLLTLSLWSAFAHLSASLLPRNNYIPLWFFRNEQNRTYENFAKDLTFLSGSVLATLIIFATLMALGLLFWILIPSILTERFPPKNQDPKNLFTQDLGNWLNNGFRLILGPGDWIISWVIPILFLIGTLDAISGISLLTSNKESFLITHFPGMKPIFASTPTLCSNSKFKTLTEKPDILEAESMSPLRLPRWSHCH
jgi:hypothetical protein